MTPYLSIIIVNHNGEKFLPRLLQSIKHQQNFNKTYEVLLVDTESSDKSIEIAKKEMVNIKIVPVRNNGYGYAANLGAKSASGINLSFFNEDMYFPPQFFYRLIKDFEDLKKSNPVGCFGVKYCLFDQKPSTEPDDYGGTVDIFGFPQKLTTPLCSPLCVNGCPMLMERSLFKKMGGYNPNIEYYSEDIDLAWRLVLAGYRNYITNSTNLFHFGGANTAKFPEKRAVNALHGVGISLLSNYSLISLIFTFPVYLILSIISLFILSWRFKTPSYVIIAIKMSIKTIKDYKNIIVFRNSVQAKRKISDGAILFHYLSFKPSLLISLRK